MGLELSCTLSPPQRPLFSSPERLMLFLLGYPAEACSRLSDSGEDAKESPVSFRFIFMFALSQSPLASHADVFRGSSRVPSGAGTRDEPLRTSAWRLNPQPRTRLSSKSGERKGATWSC